MKSSLAANHNEAQKPEVLTKALLRLAEHYELSRKDLCDIVGFSEASASRLYKETRFIDPDSKEGEIALLLLRLYRSLNAILGGNDEQARLWLRGDNRYFGTTPLQHMRQVAGLVDVVNYLDAMRGKI